MALDALCAQARATPKKPQVMVFLVPEDIQKLNIAYVMDVQ